MSAKVTVSNLCKHNPFLKVGRWPKIAYCHGLQAHQKGGSFGSVQTLTTYCSLTGVMEIRDHDSSFTKSGTMNNMFTVLSKAWSFDSGSGPLSGTGSGTISSSWTRSSSGSSLSTRTGANSGAVWKWWSTETRNKEKIKYGPGWHSCHIQNWICNLEIFAYYMSIPFFTIKCRLVNTSLSQLPFTCVKS